MTVSALASGTVDVGKYNDRNQPIRKFTPHYMAGDMGARACAEMHRDGSRDASANYYIGSDGTIVAGMQEEKRSWCSSSGANDHQAITVEVANVNDNGDVTQEAWNSLVALGADVCTRYGFTLNWTGDSSGSLTNHDMFSPTSCPGNYLRSHMPQLAQEVNAKIGAPVTGAAGGSSGLSSTSASDPYAHLMNIVNLEFSYGYHDGEMSDTHRGFMTEYDVDFSPSGATLTIEGRSTAATSFADPNSVTYKGMTIEEIIRSIAEEEGWIVDEQSIEPIADVKESTVYSLTTPGTASTGTAVGGGGSGTATGGGGIVDGTLSASQQAVIDACNSVGFQGTGWCCRWVEMCYEKAGLGRAWAGGARDHYNDYCNSSNRADLKPGMEVAVAPSGATGNAWGHVGIYVGNGQVMHNSDRVQTSTLDDWIRIYQPDDAHPVRWGWYLGKVLA